MPNPSDIEKLTFSNEIEEIVEMKDVSYLDAILMHCQENDIEESIAALLLIDTLKAKIEAEAVQLHQIKNTTKKLPF